MGLKQFFSTGRERNAQARAIGLRWVAGGFLVLFWTAIEYAVQGATHLVLGGIAWLLLADFVLVVLGLKLDNRVWVAAAVVGIVWFFAVGGPYARAPMMLGFQMIAGGTILAFGPAGKRAKP